MTTPTPTAPRPAYGLGYVVPDNALSAWGARLIVTQRGTIDFVPDRQGSDEGPHSTALLDLLNSRFTLREMRDIIAELLREHDMLTRTSEDFILYMDEDLTVHANTNASYGYCYVTAWLTEQAF